MFDFWFSLGAAVMDPGLLTTINSAVPGAPQSLFTVVPTVLVTELDAANVQLPTNVNVPNPARIAGGGRLNRGVTQTVRDTLAQYLQLNYPGSAPPVCIYTAGKFCQMLGVPAVFDLVNNIGLANQGFKTATSAIAFRPSGNFPALVGALMLDTALLTDIAGGGAAGALWEFGISDPAEQAALTALAGNGTFAGAGRQLLNQAVADPPWKICGSQYYYWPGNNDRCTLVG